MRREESFNSGVFRNMSKALHSSIEALAGEFARAVLAAIRSASLEEILEESHGAAPRSRGRRAAAAAPEEKAPRAAAA